MPNDTTHVRANPGEHPAVYIVPDQHVPAHIRERRMTNSQLRAPEAFDNTTAEIHEQIAQLELALKANAKSAALDPGNWGNVDKIVEVKSRLTDLVSFLGGAK